MFYIYNQRIRRHEARTSIVRVQSSNMGSEGNIHGAVRNGVFHFPAETTNASNPKTICYTPRSVSSG